MEDSRDILEFDETGTIVVGCDKNATEIEIPEGVKEICGDAFENCLSLATLILPSSISKVQNEAVNTCESLREILVANDNHYFLSEDGVLYSYDKKVIYAYPSGKEDTIYAIPEGVEEIGDYAFYGCKHLKQVIIPKSVIKIGKNSFAYSGINNATIPDNVKTIEAGAFCCCDSLMQIELSNSLKSISSGTFFDCTKLTYIEIPNEVQSIEEYAFTHCSSLRFVQIPSNIIDIDSSVFNECHSLERIVDTDRHLCKLVNGKIGKYGKISENEILKYKTVGAKSTFSQLNSSENKKFFIETDTSIKRDLSANYINLPEDFFKSPNYVCESQNNYRTLKEEAQDPQQIARLIFYIQDNNKDGIDSSLTTAHTLLLFLSGRCIYANTPTGKISIHSKKAKLAIETAFNLLCIKPNVIHLNELFTIEFTDKNNKEPKWRNPDSSRHNDTKNKIKALFPRIKTN